MYQTWNIYGSVTRLFVLETEFDRSMSWLGKGAEAVRTIIFPSTAKEVRISAFCGNQSLRSAVLNEGLEELMGDYDGTECEIRYSGVFSKSGLQQATLPASLRILGAGTFRDCKELKRVRFAEES